MPKYLPLIGLLASKVSTPHKFSEKGKMANNEASEGSDFDGYDGESDVVIDADGPGEPDHPTDHILGNNMLANMMFDDDMSDFDEAWIENSANFRPVHEQAFHLIPGAQIQHPPEARAIDYFDFFFTGDMWQRMVVETNRYAEQQRAANPPPAP